MSKSPSVRDAKMEVFFPPHLPLSQAFYTPTEIVQSNFLLTIYYIFNLLSSQNNQKGQIDSKEGYFYKTFTIFFVNLSHDDISFKMD